MGVLEPAWLQAAREKIGTRETAGPASNPTIMGWAKRVGAKLLGIPYREDGTPWCGLFVAACMVEAGILPAAIAIRAMAWLDWGSRLQFHRIAPGAVLVFGRSGGGHVGFYVGEDATHFHVLGGNQGDRVSVMRLEKSRAIAARWPKDVPVKGAPVMMTAVAGIPVSRNEA